MDWNAQRRQNWGAVQAKPVHSPGLSLQWLSLQPQRAPGQQGTQYPLTRPLGHIRICEHRELGMEAAGPMAPVPPAVAALLTPAPHPCHHWRYPQTPQLQGVVEVLVTLALRPPRPSPCHGISARHLDDPGCSGSVCPPGVLKGNSTLAASRHQ